MKRLPDLGIARGKSGNAVIQAGDMATTAGSEIGHQRNALFVSFVRPAPVFADRRKGTSVDFNLVRGGDHDLFAHMAVDFIEQQNDRIAKPFGEIKGPDGFVEDFLNGRRGDYDDIHKHMVQLLDIGLGR